MFEDDQTVPDAGPWVARKAGQSIAIESDDFRHDVTLTLAVGDFADQQSRIDYAHYLARALTRGCRIENALAGHDANGLVAALVRASGPHAALLGAVADELSKLRVELAESNEALMRLQVKHLGYRKLQSDSQPSALAQALAKALNAEARS